MGQGGTKHQIVDHQSLSEEEYSTLRRALGDVEDSPAAVADLQKILALFPPHLKPLVRPLFSPLVRPPLAQRRGPLRRLARVEDAGSSLQDVWDRLEKGTRIGCLSIGQVVRFEEEATNSGGSSVARISFPVAGWVVTRPRSNRGLALFSDCSASEEEHSPPLQAVVAGLSRVMTSGTTWCELLSALAGSDAEKVGASVELAAALCFWCAHPDLAPASAAGEEDLAAGVVAALRPPSPEVAAGLRNDDDDGDGEGGGSAAGVERTAQHLEGVAPCLPQAVGHCLAAALLGRPPPAAPPQLDSKILSRGHAFALGGMTSQMAAAERWQPLFRDWQDGRSFREMLRGVLHYAGLAVLVLQAETGQIFGGVSNGWEDKSGKYGGTSECLLFALEPTMRVLRPQGASESYAYLNARNEYAPRGLGFGGRLECFRLFLDSDLNSCTVTSGDATYGNRKKLLPSSEFQKQLRISRIEVWGIGGQRAKEAQDTQRAVDEGQRDKARKVDRARMCESDFDKEMLFGNTFKAAADARDKDPDKP